jgi:hypothetical protein
VSVFKIQIIQLKLKKVTRYPDRFYYYLIENEHFVKFDRAYKQWYAGFYLLLVGPIVKIVVSLTLKTV